MLKMERVAAEEGFGVGAGNGQSTIQRSEKA